MMRVVGFVEPDSLLKNMIVVIEKTENGHSYHHTDLVVLAVLVVVADQAFEPPVGMKTVHHYQRMIVLGRMISVAVVVVVAGIDNSRTLDLDFALALALALVVLALGLLGRTVGLHHSSGVIALSVEDNLSVLELVLPETVLGFDFGFGFADYNTVAVLAVRSQLAAVGSNYPCLTQ